jgi:regulator of protease activity HflC (stomatin/prohibitin superfamily)
MKFSDQQIAQMILVDAGASPGEAALSLLNDPEMVGRMADKIAARRAGFETQQREARERAIAESPEGRKKAAVAALEAEREHAQVVEGAKALLRAQGVDPEGFTERELLTATGVEKRHHTEMGMNEWDREVDQFASIAHRLPEAERVEEAARLGVNLGTLARYQEHFGGGESE